jgi:branched-chain amino acid transport system substrate-binding protein
VVTRAIRLARTAGVVLLATLAVSCASSTDVHSSASSDGSTVRIGVLYPTAGAQGRQGTEEQRGVELAAEWANARRSLGTRRIELVHESADTAESVPGDLAVLQRKGVDVVVGSHASAISQAAASIATQQHQVFWETGAVGQTLPGTGGGRNFFRMAPMGANLGAAGIDFITHQVAPSLHADHPLRYAVAYIDDPYGRAVAQGAIDEIHASSLSMVGTFEYAATTTDWTALADRIKAARPDVLYVSAYIADGIALRRALVARHVPLLANIGTSSSYCMPEFGVPLGRDAVGLFASDKPDAYDVNADALRPEGRAALKWVDTTYEHRYHEEMSAPALSGFSGAYALFVHVLPAAGGATPAAVARAALGVRLPQGTLANGSGMAFARPGQPDAGDNRNATSVIWEWVAPGQRAIVWPATFANHPVAVLPLTS